MTKKLQPESEGFPLHKPAGDQWSTILAPPVSERKVHLLTVLLGVLQTMRTPPGSTVRSGHRGGTTAAGQANEHRWQQCIPEIGRIVIGEIPHDCPPSGIQMVATSHSIARDGPKSTRARTYVVADDGVAMHKGLARGVPDCENTLADLWRVTVPVHAVYAEACCVSCRLLTAC
ncbi:uncharacterized protein B0I36DRAFT_134045 [Microdochium trichocladiopsis]|uniref:Uncharacterized protein n=1 Tax=Microdochium trichocladiopsis TaxID=1682393 RepID=A0A9P8Y582_9PEZI|nr:uncharacterized protein B0I36DRAFT_134045 [Microdochium trichocladiopsis]KAH7029599.1 hypothetical protein B0I36DRAFT_134045 [Microdochium trichocladiopsis]